MNHADSFGVRRIPAAPRHLHPEERLFQDAQGEHDREQAPPSPPEAPQIANQTVNDGLVAKNPYSPKSIPLLKPKKRQGVTVNEAQRLNSIIHGIPTSAPHCAVLLALHTGMRRGGRSA